MEGFGGGKSWDGLVDPIVPLLYQSDCDGILTPEECATIAPRLRELVENWSDHWTMEHGKQIINYDKENALKLAMGMEKAAASNENLEFC